MSSLKLANEITNRYKLCETFQPLVQHQKTSEVPQDADESWDMTGRSDFVKSLKPANLTPLICSGKDWGPVDEDHQWGYWPSNWD